MGYFDNKVVWITGASSGIGEALAKTFSKQQVRLVLSSRREDELIRVKAACGLPEEDILILPLDISDHGSLEAAVQTVIGRFGQIDILINNAGLSHWSKIKDTTLEVIKTILNVNFLGSVGLTKAVLPYMLDKKRGHIVVISSILGKIVTPKQGAYNASKHALQGFFDTLRAETSGGGIKVLLVCPGFVRTNVAKNSLDRNGQPINKDNNLIAGGLDPLYVSEQVLDAIQSYKEEIIVAGAKEKFAILIKRFAPGIFSKFISNNKLA
jgi:dehydrogenase/reductase SDR family protein 7B